MYDFLFFYCKMLVIDIIFKKFVIDNNGNVCKDKDYSNMEMEKKLKKFYLLNVFMVIILVCFRGFFVFGFNLGDMVKKFMIICKYF